MFKESPLAQSLRVACNGGVAALSVTGALGLGMATQASAQEPTGAPIQQGERVEVTGSSIKRIGAETALPIITLTSEDIKKTGFTSSTDLIQSLPSMQGFLTASNSVNGGGGGATNASLHSIGSQYTLVLLNGRRLAPYNTGTTVNLNTIPLNSIERIEILLDGASALYGADAIAGVVNFITKKNSSDGELTVTGFVPQHEGGKSGVASLSKGYGDVDKQGFNIFGAISAEKQKELTAAQRDFSKTGIYPFSDTGRSLTAFQTSSNTIPGAVFVNDRQGNALAAFSPSLLETGACGPKTFLRNGVCRFDFASTVDTVPEYERYSGYLSGRFKFSDALTVFGEGTLASFKNKPVYAPPAQPGIFLTQALYNRHVLPFLAQMGVDPATVAPPGDPNFFGPTTNLRVYDAGGRTDEYKTNTGHVVGGVEGTIGPVDYSGYYTHSQNRFTDRLMGGYLSANAFNALVASGAFDPLAAGIGQAQAVLAPAVLHQLFDTTMSTIDVVHGQASATVFRLPAGDLQVAAGAEGQKQKFKDSPSALSQGANSLQPNFTDTTIGGSSGALPFDASRKSYGAFVETVVPIVKGLEFTGSVRHDHYSAVTNDELFDANGVLVGSGTQGKTAQSTTYKGGIRYVPVPELLFRASIGTGFKAPTLNQISSTVQAFGNTGFHLCPPGLAAAIAARCQNVAAEYNLRMGGNPNTDSSGLDPEKSKQFTIGFRFEPSQALSFGFDYWNVKLKQRIDVVPENTAFADGVTYGSLFSVRPDPITGAPTLTYTQQPLNLGKARYKGLDFDAASRISTPIGALTTKGTFTYMLQSDYQVAGTPGYQSDLGKVGADTQVTFRWLLNVSTSLDTGPFTNTLVVRVKPTYHDDPATPTTQVVVRTLNPNGTVGGLVSVNRDVASYTVFDYQLRYNLNRYLNFTFGVRNLFDRNPPLSILAENGTGNAQGFDGRYTDPLGRTFYLGAALKF